MIGLSALAAALGIIYWIGPAPLTTAIGTVAVLWAIESVLVSKDTNHEKSERRRS